MSTVSKRNFYLIVFLLSTILILELSYISSKSSKENLSTFSLSTYTTNKIASGISSSKSNKKHGTLISYSPSSNEEWLNGLNNADYIFEYINNEGLLAYDSIFYSREPYKPSPITSFKKVSLESIPKFSFSNNLNKIYDKNQKASYIFITMNYDTFSNFIYENGYYTHFKNTRLDMDARDYKTIFVSNIIVQYTDNYDGIANLYEVGAGKGILFSGGKAIDIEWEKNVNATIEIRDTSGNDITLLDGKVWWVILNKNCYLTYN